MPGEWGEPAGTGQPQIVRSGGRGARRAVTRRDLIVGTGGIMLGVGATVVALQRSTPEETQHDPFEEAQLDAGPVVDLERRIQAEGQVLLEANPLIAIIAWDPSMPYRDGRTAADVYGPEGEGHPMTSNTTGLMALVLRSTHRGCRVTRCPSSGWFEDPCHGSRWNSWGEWTGGPAPRGLDRLASEVVDERLVLQLSPLGLVAGPSRQARVLQEPPAGPSCTDGQST